MNITLTANELGIISHNMFSLTSHEIDLIRPLLVFFLLILGMALGSFFNVVIYRLPENKSLLPPSRCPKCNYSIPFWLNIPIFSWLLLKGKCRNCGTKISWHYIIVEALTPLIFLSIYYRFGTSHPVIFFKYIIFFSYGIIITFIDYYHMRIPFKLSIPLNIIGLLTLFIPGNDISIMRGLVGGIGSFIFFVLLMVLYYYVRKKEGLGFGDVLLISAIGFFTGILNLAMIIVIASFLGVIIMTLVMKYSKDKLFPFGPFLIIASWIYMLWGYKLFEAYWEFINYL